MSACFRPDPPVTVRVWAEWPGASVEDVEARLTLPLEESLGGLPGANRLIGESWSGVARVSVTVPAESATGVAAAMDRVELPPEAGKPWAETAPAKVSEWIVPVLEAEGMVGALTESFGPGAAWCDTCVPVVTEVVLPPGPVADAIVARLLAEPAWDSTDQLLDSAPVAGGPTVRAAATEVRKAARTWARWNGDRSAVLYVARPTKDVAKWWADRPAVKAKPIPTENAVYLDLWGSDAESVEATIRANGAKDVLVLVRRPMPGGDPEPGRVEVVARWDGPVPDLSALGRPRALSGSHPVVRGPAERLRALGPRPRTTWDVEVDPTRAAAVGLDADRVAAAVSAATVGHRFVAGDGTAVEVLVGEAASADVVAAVRVGEHEGRPVTVRDVATVKTVRTERYRLRYDGAPAAIGPGVDLQVVGEIVGSPLSW